MNLGVVYGKLNDPRAVYGIVDGTVFGIADGTRDRLR